MSNRNGAQGTNSSPPGARPAERVHTPEDEALSDAIHALLREGADQREARTLAQVAEDRTAARQQFESILQLSRERHATRR